VQKLEYDNGKGSYATTSDTRKVEPTDDFTVYMSSLNKNGGRVNSGIIPSILYAYA
jgi:hypothetical protein